MDSMVLLISVAIEHGEKILFVKPLADCIICVGLSAVLIGGDEASAFTEIFDSLVFEVMHTVGTAG